MIVREVNRVEVLSHRVAGRVSTSFRSAPGSTLKTRQPVVARRPAHPAARQRGVAHVAGRLVAPSVAGDRIAAIGSCHGAAGVRREWSRHLVTMDLPGGSLN